MFLIPGVPVETLRARRESLAAELTQLRLRSGLPEDGEVRIRVSGIEAADTAAVEQLRVYGTQYFRNGGFTVDSEISELTATGLSLKDEDGEIRIRMQLEKRYITSELYKSGGNITRAAENLGVHRPQLSTLIKKHKVRREDFELEK